jgi:hypothetical protein
MGYFNALQIASSRNQNPRLSLDLRLAKTAFDATLVDGKRPDGRDFKRRLFVTRPQSGPARRGCECVGSRLRD